MNDYVTENERILKKWQKAFIEDKKHEKKYIGEDVEKFFAYDGIMNKGEFAFDENKSDGTIIRKPSGNENTLWNDCPLRVLFLTKEENTGGDENTVGDEAWDVRAETFHEKGDLLPPENKTISSSFFYCNEACLLYGLLNTKPNKKILFDSFSWQEALEFSDEKIFARINCKKEVGGPSISDFVLQKEIGKYDKSLKAQILNLDADILICCGSQNGKNIILETVKKFYEKEYKEEFEYVDCVKDKGTGMHYNKKRNKLAIDAYHLAYFKGGYKARYSEIIDMYYEFLKHLKNTEGIDFSASHR